MQQRKSTILVLGASGRLGTLLRAHWALNPADGCEIWFQSRSPLPGPNTIEWTPGQPVTALPRCQTVVALWGQTAGTAQELTRNVSLADESRAVARSTGATRVLHLSSAAIYGPVENATEATPASPVAAYGQSKWEMEQHIATFRDDGTSHCCLRLANVVGADSLAPALEVTAPVTLDRFENSTGPMRSYIGARDLGGVMIALARLSASHLPPVLNVAAPHPIAMQHLAEAAGKKIVWRTAPPEALQKVTVDSGRLRRLLPKLDLISDPETLIADWRKQTRNA